MKKVILLLLFVTLMVGCTKEPTTLEEYIKAGEEAFVEGEYYQARLYLSHAVAQRSSDKKLLLMLGVTYEHELMHDSAVHFLKRADLLFPDNREINEALYEASLGALDWKNARTAMQTLIKIGDTTAAQLDALAELSLSLEDFPWAHYYYVMLLEMEPDNPDRYLQVANIAAEIGKSSESIALMDSAIERFGPSEAFLANKGIYCVVQNRYAEAEKIFRSLVAKDSTALGYRMNLANALVSQDNSDKQYEAYRIYLALRQQVGNELRLDSTIAALKKRLNLDSK